MSSLYQPRRRWPPDPNDPEQFGPDQSMYGPNLGGGGMPPPQPTPSMYGPAQPQPEQPVPQLFTPPPMPSMSAPTKDITQSAPPQQDALAKANATLYAPRQNEGGNNESMSRPTPPKFYTANDPEVKANMGPIDRMDGAKRFHVAQQMNAAAAGLYGTESNRYQQEQAHQLQSQYARNLGMTAPAEGQLIAIMRDPTSSPELKAWAQSELDKAKKFNQPPAKDAHYTRSVEVVNGKPTVMWVNDNDPTDRKPGGTAAPHEFAPPTTQISFTPTGQPVVFDPRAKTLSSPTWTGEPLPQEDAPPSGMPGVSSGSSSNAPGGAPTQNAPAPAPQQRSGILPQGPYTKGVAASGSALSPEEIKLNADAIQSGRKPPVLSGFGRAGAGKISAELERRGFDLSRATSDWTATQKHLATLNGTQQTRLQQAIVTASESLGVIEDLAKQWDGGGFPILNRAQLALAKNGVLGPKAQQIATNLQAQITDVTSELGNIYMGGNSPTDHALALAQKNLSADWNRDQLLSAVRLARTNIAIRRNSITTSQAVGVSQGSPYSPQMQEAPLPTGPSGGETPESIKADFKAHKITREQAKQKLAAHGIQ